MYRRPAAVHMSSPELLAIVSAISACPVLSSTLVYRDCIHHVNNSGVSHCISDYDLPWEDNSMAYPANFASPVDVIVEGSNGASDYGNKYGQH